MGAFQSDLKPVSNHALSEAVAASLTEAFDVSGYQIASVDIWRDKYRLCDAAGNPIDSSILDTYVRVARALSANEATEALQGHWFNRFLWAMINGAIPAGRVLANAGAEAFKPAVSTINCTVSQTLHDSMDGIMQAQMLAARTLKAGCGIGYEFSTLRPAGAFVYGAGAATSGPLSFMDIFDRTCKTIRSAGGRRGAQMATFDCQHPDIFEFIKVKREAGRMREFNLSVLITDALIHAVRTGSELPLVFPTTTRECEILGLDLTDPEQVIYREWPLHDEGYIVDKSGLVACRVYRKVNAQRLWNAIMALTYDVAEPGFLLIDQINEMNNNWFCELIRATNPCGEQPLPPNGACLLGSVDLTRFVRNPFSPEAHFDFDTFTEVVGVFTRMLDNVVEANGLPLQQQRDEIMRKRRHGMGFTGLGSSMAMLGMRYGDDASLVFADKVSETLALEGWRQALELAKEKGAAPIMDERFSVTGEMLRKRPEMAARYCVGDQIKGKVLHVSFGRYMAKIAERLGPKWYHEALEYGLRFTHHSSIAPTGTISLSLGNNCSNGIEPSFAHHYMRNVIVPGKKTKRQVSVMSAELFALKRLRDEQTGGNWQIPMIQEHGYSRLDLSQLPGSFVDAGSITPREHVLVQAAVQRWVDSSISKTINVPTDMPFGEFEDIYMLAYDHGLKGCTTFRYNPENFSGVLVNEADLASTTYEFELENGETVRLKGNEKVIYEGEEHIASNLFDALKEGQYGRF